MADPDFDLFTQTDHKLLQLEAKLRPGDIIAFPFTGFLHYGIYIGHGLLIHRLIFNLKEKGGNIILTRFCHYSRTAEAFQSNFLDHSHTALPAEEIVRKAISKLGSKGFDLLDYNCEHFATWCRYGKEISLQRNRILIGAVVTMFLVTAMMTSVAACRHSTVLGLFSLLVLITLQLVVLAKTFPDLVMRFKIFRIDRLKSFASDSITMQLVPATGKKLLEQFCKYR